MHPEVHVTQFDIDRVADHRGNSTALAAAADEVEVLIGQAPTARPLTVLAPSALALGAEVDAPALVARAEHAQATDLVLMQLNYARSSFARDDDPTGVVHATYLALGQPIPDRWAVKAAQADRAALPPAHTITCQQCREHIPNDGRFCPFCGVPITYTATGRAWTGGRDPLRSDEVDALEAIAPLATSEAAIADEVSHLLGLPATTRPVTVLQPTMLAPGAHVDEPFLVSRMAESTAADLMLAQINWCTTVYAQSDDPEILVEATYSALGQDTPDQWARGQKDDATEPVSSGASIPCQQCGNELPEHARFCRQCGQRVTYTDSGQAWTGGREPLSSQEVDDLEAIEPLATSEAAIADEVNHLLGLPAAQRPLTVLQPTMLARGAEVDEPFLVSRMAQSAAADLTLAQIDWCTTEYAKNDDPKRLVELVSQATRGMPKSRTPRPSLPPQKAPRPIDLPPPPVRMRVDYD